jgi:YHS domain-containing protein
MTNQEPQPTQAIDPVCGMTVDIARAIEAGLAVEHDGQHYYFCGRGCKLEFEDDPRRYLDPTYQPSM